MSDKFKAVWVSYSSISDYLKCPRAYFLKNIYKNPSTGRKMEITKPALSLGSAVHSVLEPLSNKAPKDRFSADLIETFDTEFVKYFGKKGGFIENSEFETYRSRGHKMIQTVVENKQILENPTYKPKEDLLNAWLSKKENIVICGKIDWIDINTKTKELSVIDFKTSKEEESNPLQLQIYALLLHILNKETVNKLNYWYLDLNATLTETELPDLKESLKKVLELALTIKEARELNHFECKRNGCYACKDYENVLLGNAAQVGIGGFNREVYFVG